VNAHNARIWTASVVIGIEPKSAQIGGFRAMAAGRPLYRKGQ
jgi:hypothetical protein